MLGLINPFGAARGNTSLLVFWLLFLVLKIMLATAVSFGGLGKLWGEKINTKTLFDLFPGTPSKQAGKIAGLPESMRKGGY